MYVIIVVSVIDGFFYFDFKVQTKWSERKVALEGLDKLTSKPKIEAGQFGDVMGCLKKVRISCFGKLSILVLC